MPMMMAQKPLMLKDFLEIEANSDSCDGFGCAPRRLPTTVRCLLDAEIAGGRRLVRSRSRGAVSAVIGLFSTSTKPTSAAATTGPHHAQCRFPLPRSLSKKLRRSFWNMMRGEPEAPREIRVRVRDIVRLRSFQEGAADDRRSLYFPSSPVVSSCSSSSDGTDSSDFMLSSCGSSEFSGEPAAAAVAGGGEDKAASPKGKVRVGGGESYRETDSSRWEAKEEQGNEAMECGECNSEEEKEQLSPVSVMDFPSEDEDNGEEDDDDCGEVATASPRFRRTLETIERTRHELLQKIRRFESLAELDLEPVDLDSRFAACESVTSGEGEHVTSDEEEERDAGWDLLCQFKARTPELQECRSIERVLLGFFDEGLLCLEDSQSRVQWRRCARTERRRETVEEGLMAAAREWVGGGGGCARREDMAGAEQLREMERGVGWMCLEEGEEEVAEEVEAGVLGWLVDELVLDLVSTC